MMCGLGKWQSGWRRWLGVLLNNHRLDYKCSHCLVNFKRLLSYKMSLLRSHFSRSMLATVQHTIWTQICTGWSCYKIFRVSGFASPACLLNTSTNFNILTTLSNNYLNAITPLPPQKQTWLKAKPQKQSLLKTTRSNSNSSLKFTSKRFTVFNKSTAKRNKSTNLNSVKLYR